MSPITLSMICSFLCLTFQAVTKENHFVIIGNPSQLELEALINNHELIYKSHSCLGSDLHYFLTRKTGENLVKLYENLLRTPWINGVDHQDDLFIEKKIGFNLPNSRYKQQVEALELPNDDEYAFVYKRHVERLRNMLKFNDPNAPYVWQFLNAGDLLIGRSPGIDLNVYPVYASNITGRNVIGIIVDDALDTTHEDLEPNIKSELLADLIDNTRLDARGTDAEMSKADSHGTEVGGLFAAVSNNSRCAFGVAYDAKLGAVRLLGNKVTDYMIGEALSLFSENASIYISSWGPKDDGKTMRSPGKYMRKALKYTSLKGNHGRGAVFVFPTGNGGVAGDNCGADGFVNHPDVIGVSAVSEDGLPPYYSESCSAVTVAVPVGGSEDKITFKKQLTTHFFVTTTQINNMCTKSFVGTSASNPMAAGVIALAMEANPNITARDVSAILALSGRIPTASASDIDVNGGGLLVSHTYGSGLLNAVRMVKLARHWISLGPRRTCSKHYGECAKRAELTSYRRSLYPYRTVSFTFTFNSTDCEVEVIEVVRVGMQWTCERRGSIDVVVVSPSGQVAHLLRPRIKDHFNGNTKMIWKSLMHTGESCYGKWVVKVRDVGWRKHPLRAKRGKVSGMVNFIGIDLLGTLRNESALEQNKHHIIKHWHPFRLFARNTGRALKLDQKRISEIYDHDRWQLIHETIDS